MSPINTNASDKSTSNLERQVFRFFQTEALANPGETLLVGVSGGPDSLCLLKILHSLKDRLDLNLHVVHLNHLLRGEEAEEDTDFVTTVAEALDLPITVGARDVAGYRRRHRLSLEEAAREVRYRFFHEIAADIGAVAVAVGHTADDQAETILLHIIRGTGLAGLSGMQPKTELKIDPSQPPLIVIRPLLNLSRQQTTGYCSAVGMEPQTDSSNQSLKLMRNRVRAELLPTLESFNPNIGNSLRRIGRSATQALNQIDEQILTAWTDIVNEAPGSLTIFKENVVKLHPALQQRFFQMAAERVLGKRAPLRESHILSMISALNQKTSAEISLPGGLNFKVSYQTAILSIDDASSLHIPEEAEFLQVETPLSIPGTTELPAWIIQAELVSEINEASLPQGWEAVLDYAAVGEDLSVRGRLPGDRFQPLGLPHSKKLKDFMVDAKIPRERRDSIPLVVSSEGIVWVVGWRVDHRARVTPSTRQYLHLTFNHK